MAEEINVIRLARYGLIAIRNLLRSGTPEHIAAALELAEILHNLPTPDDTQAVRTVPKRLKAFAEQHPEFDGMGIPVSTLVRIVGMETTD